MGTPGTATILLQTKITIDSGNSTNRKGGAPPYREKTSGDTSTRIATVRPHPFVVTPNGQPHRHPAHLAFTLIGVVFFPLRRSTMTLPTRHYLPPSFEPLLDSIKCVLSAPQTYELSPRTALSVNQTVLLTSWFVIRLSLASCRSFPAAAMNRFTWSPRGKT